MEGATPDLSFLSKSLFFITQDQTDVASQLLLYDPCIYKHMDGVWRAFFIRLVPCRYGQKVLVGTQKIFLVFALRGCTKGKWEPCAVVALRYFFAHILVCHPISVCACIWSHTVHVVMCSFSSMFCACVRKRAFSLKAKSMSYVSVSQKPLSAVSPTLCSFEVTLTVNNHAQISLFYGLK